MKKVKIDNQYKEIKIDLNEFAKLLSDEQYKKIEETLNKMYEGKVEITKAFVLKCIKLTIAKEDDLLYLRSNLVVEKDSKTLIFRFKKKTKKWPIIILLLLTLLIGVFSATYSGLIYVETINLNKDIDGDGVADINIDLNNDRIADINVDTDGDDLPDVNIDYKGNRESIFNQDTDGDGIPDKNLVNDATDGKECEVNCDTNGDGWPDTNYDTNGDGKPDFDIDSDKDGFVDTSIDLNGDMLCDIMCDDDNDGVCDRSCIVTLIDPTNPDEDDDYIGSGSSEVTGNDQSNINSGKLSVVYEDNGELYVEGLVPTDQGGEIVTPQKAFVITNLSDFEVYYKLTFEIESNTFTSQNFKYKIESTNGGFASDFQTAPWEDTLLTSYVTIPPLSSQEYTITFMLEGINAPQDFDQGQKFVGNIKVGE